LGGWYDRAFPLLDPLLACAALVVAGDTFSAGLDMLVMMKPMRGQNTPGCHSTLAITRRGFDPLPA
jgi:hypothetical protein